MPPRGARRVLPANHDHRVDPVVEQGGDRLARDAVAVVLQPVDLDRVVRDVLEAAQPRHGLGDLARTRVQHLCQLLGLDHRRLDVVEPEVVGDLLGVVHDIVERGGQLVDVLPVYRGDESLVEALDDVVRDPVAILLADEDVAGHSLLVLGSRAASPPEAGGTRSCPGFSNRRRIRYRAELDDGRRTERHGSNEADAANPRAGSALAGRSGGSSRPRRQAPTRYRTAFRRLPSERARAAQPPVVVPEEWRRRIARQGVPTLRGSAIHAAGPLRLKLDVSVPNTTAAPRCPEKLGVISPALPSSSGTIRA